MLGSFYCLDNDIILKLVTFNLFNDTLRSFSIDAPQVKILDTFKYKVGNPIKRNKGKKVKNISQATIEEALQITKDYTTISDKNFDIDIDIFTKLCDYFSKLNNDSETSKKIDKNQDKGEAILMSHICYLSQQGHHNNYLLTSDKKCLRDLSISDFTDIIEHLNGKIWCLEQLILKYIEEFGFHIIQPKIYPVRDCDEKIKMIFGYTIEAGEDRVKEDLKSEIRVLRQKTGNLLYPSNVE